jgi:hypothetical protein
MRIAVHVSPSVGYASVDAFAIGGAFSYIIKQTNE